MAADLAATRESVAALRRTARAVLAIIGGLFGRSYRQQIAPVWR
jgi:hypothetical protein